MDGNGTCHSHWSFYIGKYFIINFIAPINSNTRILCAKNKRLVWKSVWECKYFLIATKFTFTIRLAQTLCYISSKVSWISLSLCRSEAFVVFACSLVHNNRIDVSLLLSFYSHSFFFSIHSKICCTKVLIAYFCKLFECSKAAATSKIPYYKIRQVLGERCTM